MFGLCSSSVMLGNRAPDQPVLAISPNPATSLDSIECVLSSATDPDGDSVSATYAWYVNSILDPAETVSTYGGSLASGDTVACTVITSDGALNSPMGSATLILSNTPPVIDSLVLSPDPLRTADTVTATVVSSDADGDAVTLASFGVALLSLAVPLTLLSLAVTGCVSPIFHKPLNKTQSSIIFITNRCGPTLDNITL